MTSISGINSTLYQLYQNTSLSTTTKAKSSTLSVQNTGAFLSGLVENGSITEEQQQKIQSAFAQAMQLPPPPKEAQRVDFVSDAISGLVEDETLTAEQADTVQSAIEDALCTGELSPEEAREAVEKKLAELVDAGTITDEQSVSITSALDKAAQSALPPPPPQRGQGLPPEISQSLSTLVEEGAITEEEEDSIIEYLLKAQESGTKPDLSELVVDGLLSEEKKNAVEDTFREAHSVTEAKRAYAGHYTDTDPLQQLVEDGTISSSAKSLIYQTLTSYGSYSTVEKYL